MILSLAFSRLSFSVSFLIRSLSFLTRKISISVSLVRASISCTGRQLSVAPKWRAVLHAPDKHCRHRGSNAGDAPLLLELEGAADEGDVVIGGKEGDQAEGEAAEHLEHAEVVETQPAAG